MFALRYVHNQLFLIYYIQKKRYLRETCMPFSDYLI